MSTWEAPRDQVAVFVILSGLKEELKTSQVAFCLYNINCGVEKLNFHTKKKKKSTGDSLTSHRKEYTGQF